MEKVINLYELHGICDCRFNSGTDINRSFDKTSNGLAMIVAKDEGSMFGGNYRIMLIEK